MCKFIHPSHFLAFCYAFWNSIMEKKNYDATQPWLLHPSQGTAIEVCGTPEYHVKNPRDTCLRI